MLGHAGVGAPGEDPRPGGLGGLEQALAQVALQPGLQLEVGLAPVDRDEQLGLLQAPLAQQQGQHQVRPGVVRQTDVLQDKTIIGQV